MEKKIVSQVIRRYREKLGMDLSEFGKHIGKSKSTVSLYESGKRTPKLELFIEALNELSDTVWCKQECPTCNGSGVIVSVIEKDN